MAFRALSLASGLSFIQFAFASPHLGAEPIAFPNALMPRAGGVTPDNTCGLLFAGNGTGYICDPTNAYGGQCCSSSGYCGNSDAYCGLGCQKDFGYCQGTEVLPRSTTVCGAGVAICTSGLCCSGSGYCGNTTDYCYTTNGCQSPFGDCTVPPGTTPPTQETCGPNFGGTSCNNGNCCSTAGYCGSTKAYCADPDCQYKYGKCDSNTTPAGPSTADDPRPKVGTVSYNDEILDCVVPNVVGLSFDDGPYIYTSRLLDILKSYGFRATFFITGNNLGKGAIDTTAPYPDIIKRMYAEGHQVASHSWSHYDLSLMDSAGRKLQMTKNERAIANIIGKYPTYMRPPYSSCTAESGCVKDIIDLGYHRIELDLDTTDYLNPSPSQIQAPKDIVRAALTTTDPAINDYLSIQHDIIEQSVTNLTSYFFDLIKQRGWKGVTVGECLNDPKANWYRTPLGDASSSSSSSSTSSSSSSTSSSGSAPTSTTTSSSGSAPTSTTSSSSSTSSASSTSSSSSSSSSSTSSTSSTSSSTSSSSSSSSSSTSTTPTTTYPTKTQTTIPPPPPTQTCTTLVAGKYCFKLMPFGDKLGCMRSQADCMRQALDCFVVLGPKSKDLGRCRDLKAWCGALARYCLKCGFKNNPCDSSHPPA